MPITYQTNTAFGSLLASLVGRLIKDQADILRLMNYANAATGGGVTPSRAVPRRNALASSS